MADPARPLQVVAIGEPMLELRAADAGLMRLAAGGDALNTAIYLARLGVRTHLLTALGEDPYSDEMIADWTDEGLDSGLILRHPTRLPGLYAIRTDARGERRFFYWRGQSAARALFDLPGTADALARAETADWLYLSGITLSIFGPDDRARLIALAGRVRANGGAVAFDPNYRPADWAKPEEARSAFAAIAPLVTLALPTIEDEDRLFGPLLPEEHAERWRNYGCAEVVLKCGADGCLVLRKDEPLLLCPPVAPIEPLDTTGAGDSFNAAYLAGRLAGLSPAHAAAHGNRLAGIVIQHRGAILPRAVMPALELSR